MKRKSLFTALAFSAVSCLMISSCRTADNITYFQDIDTLPDSMVAPIQVNNTVIEPKDEMTILVNAENMAAVAGFNKPLYNTQESGTRSVSTLSAIQSYVVDANGDIDFPTLGKIHVAGMTKEALEGYLKARIEAYVTNPIVAVDLLNYPVLVLGEVGTPGMTYHNNRHATLLDAIAKAHDLNIYGDRTNILLLREENGIRTKHRIDLTKSEVLSSPYFYLKQNDMIYVAPNHARKASSQYNSMKQQNLSTISTIVGVISMLATLAVAIWK